uniref:M56 family metallopeptidase n=1 Tax=Sphingobium phenoxybenzoativorans TaxID=1592790 RepID=UPI0008730A1F
MTGWMVEALAASALLMALVMMLRRPATHLFGAQAAYLLWALPALRMLLPPLPTGGVVPTALPQGFLAQGLGLGLSQGLGQGALVVFHQPAGTPGGDAGLPWVEMAIALWMAGAIVFAGFQIAGYIRFRRRLLSDGEVIGREGRVTIIESAHASGPLAFGVFRKYVALPIDFADHYDAEERAFALAHECAHHDRGDLAANMAALALLALHWCNPLAWIAYRAFRADQELACDALVLARHAGANPAVYGRAILKAASGRHFAAACHLRTVDNLKGRLKMLASHSVSLRRISWGMAVMAAITVTGLALTASGSGAARQMAEVSQTVRESRLAKMASFMPLAGGEKATGNATVSAPANAAAGGAMRDDAVAAVEAAPAAPA